MTEMKFTQNQADALAGLLGWDGAPDMPIADRTRAIEELLALRVIEFDEEDDEFFVINSMKVAEQIMAGMDRGELAR